jgi:hypothetical protein
MRPKIEIKTGVEPYGDGSGYKTDIAVEWDSETGLTKIQIDQATVDAESWEAVKAEVDRALSYVRGRP